VSFKWTSPKETIAKVIISRRLSNAKHSWSIQVTGYQYRQEAQRQKPPFGGIAALVPIQLLRSAEAMPHTHQANRIATESAVSLMRMTAKPRSCTGLLRDKQLPLFGLVKLA